MEDLHNQTGTAAGHFCYGFSDCLVTVEVIGSLLRLTPLPEATELLVKLQEAENNLLDLALLSNTLPDTTPEHKGVYYCEAYNEQGAIQSRQVNLTVLGTCVAQLAQYLTFNINATTNDSFDDVIDEASAFGSGSISGSGIVDTPQNITTY